MKVLMEEDFMVATAAQQYKDNQISFASPGQTVLMLYDGAIKFLEAALKELSENKDLGKKARLVERAVKIIDYLQSCLDKERGGKLAENFDRLYCHMLIELTQANFENDARRIGSVIKLIQPLRDAWAEICSGEGKSSPRPVAAASPRPAANNWKPVPGNPEPKRIAVSA
ncbi:MAG: flagellar export chaperone FliS [Nitrospirae bacterium]|nr:flagellar export chaperone FliS [Nitrospirota bacterium]